MVSILFLMIFMGRNDAVRRYFEIWTVQSVTVLGCHVKCLDAALTTFDSGQGKSSTTIIRRKVC